MSNLISDTPIIKTFIHDNKCYIYDAYKNQLLSVSKDFFVEICELQKLGINHYKNSNRDDSLFHDIIMMINKGFFHEKFIEKVEHPSTKYLAHLIKRCMSQLIIEVTSACNFRCRYCHQTDTSAVKPKMMRQYIAYRSVDLLYDHSKDAHEVFITFYGGEPLLNFDLIKSVVSYSQNKFNTKPIYYNITTNASLLNYDKLKFLHDNNFSLLISMDGDEKIQNHHRKYVYDGSETFTDVWNNILSIRDNYPLYFKNNISFNSVILEDESQEDILNFFKKHDIAESAINIRYADLNGIDYTYSGIHWIENEVDKGEGNIEERYVNILKSFNNKNRIANTWHHNGPCIPVAKRLFVNTEGDFFPCERVGYDSSCLLGNIESGIDFDKATEILNIGNISENDCKKCWALRFCSICVQRCIDNGRLSYEKKKIACERHKEEAMDYFKKYINNKNMEGRILK